MKKGDKKRRWWEAEEPHPTEPLTPEEERFMLGLIGGCLLPMVMILLLVLVALFVGYA